MVQKMIDSAVAYYNKPKQGSWFSRNWWILVPFIFLLLSKLYTWLVLLWSPSVEQKEAAILGNSDQKTKMASQTASDLATAMGYNVTQGFFTWTYFNEDEEKIGELLLFAAAQGLSKDKISLAYYKIHTSNRDLRSDIAKCAPEHLNKYDMLGSGLRLNRSGEAPQTRSVVAASAARVEEV